MDSEHFSKKEIAEYVRQMLSELAKVSRPLKSEELEQSLRLSRMLADDERGSASRLSSRRRHGI